MENHGKLRDVNRSGLRWQWKLEGRQIQNVPRGRKVLYCNMFNIIKHFVKRVDLLMDKPGNAPNTHFYNPKQKTDGRFL